VTKYFMNVILDLSRW